MAEGKVPVRESVGAALRIYRENVPAIWMVAGVAAVVTTGLGLLATSVPAIGFLCGVAGWFVAAFAYSAYLALALPKEGVSHIGAAQGGFVKVLAALAVLGFFLFIVGVVLAIVAVAVFIAMAANYLPQIEAAGQDQAAMQAIVAQIAMQNPLGVVAIYLIFVVPFLLITSRLYLVAPATFESGRVRVFETWAWTKGNMWRIVGARLMLLLPAAILSGAITMLVMAPLGANIYDPATMMSFITTNPVAALASNLLQFGLMSALEAPLSAYLYRGLKPQTETTAAPPPVA